MTKLQTGIFGCGGIAHKHAQALASLPDDVELVAICDHTPAKAGAFSESYTQRNAQVYLEQRQLFAPGDLDLAVITIPPHQHTDQVELASRNDIHLLVEKPIALTSEKAWRMVAAAEEAGIKTQVGFKLRLGEAVERLKALIESGESGLAGLMATRYFCNSLHASWWRQREKSGGQLVEQAIHMLDLMRYLLGEPTSVYCRQANLFHDEIADYTAEDVSATVIAFQNGALGVLSATNGAIPGQRINDFQVVTKNITAEFEDANHAALHFTGSIDRPVKTIALGRDLFRSQALDLIQAIRNHGETRTLLSEGARTLDLALAAVHAAGQRVEVIF